jgi:hypothetical protein
VELIPAVRAGRVYAVNGPVDFNRPGPASSTEEILAALFHPEIFPAASAGRGAKVFQLPLFIYYLRETTGRRARGMSRRPRA